MKTLLLRFIRAYQTLTRGAAPSPLWFGMFSGCRSWPTCSDYAYQSIARDGALRGTARAVVRVLRCNPWMSHHA